VPHRGDGASCRRSARGVPWSLWRRSGGRLIATPRACRPAPPTRDGSRRRRREDPTTLDPLADRSNGGKGLLRGDAQLSAGVAPQERSVAAAVVAEDASDCDAALGKPRNRVAQDLGSGLLGLLVAGLDVGDSGVVVDDGVQVTGSDQRVVELVARSRARCVAARFLLPLGGRCSATRRRLGRGRASSPPRGPGCRASCARNGGSARRWRGQCG
jgi:hypothetical protein